MEINNTGVTGRILPHDTDFEHARVWPTYFRLRFLDHDRHTYQHTYIYHAKSRLNTPVWGSLRSPKYLTLPRGISVYIESKVGIFSEAEGRGKYSLPRVQYMPIFHKEGFLIFSLLHRVFSMRELLYP